MRLSALVFSASMLIGCALPARADYVYDFQFTGGSYFNLNYGPSEIVFRSPSLDSTNLTYVSGSINGYMPPTVTVGTAYYEGKPFLPVTEYSALNSNFVGDFAVVGFDFETEQPVNGVGVYPEPFVALLSIDLPNSFFNPGQSGFQITNDVESFATVTVTQTPEPQSLVLLGTGVLGAAGVVRRRLGV